jgi:hypothetical protein
MRSHEAAGPSQKDFLSVTRHGDVIVVIVVTVINCVIVEV